MFCKKCGKNIPPWSKFCRGCGGTAPRGELSKIGIALLFSVLAGGLVLFTAYLVSISSLPNKIDLQQRFAYPFLFCFFSFWILLLLKIILSLRRHPVSGTIRLVLFVGLISAAAWGIYRVTFGSASLRITVIKGPISGASVRIYELKDDGEKGKEVAGPRASDASGNVTFYGLALLPKRLKIEAKGGSYQDEATGQQVQLKDTDIFSAVLPAGTKTVAVTPFTHMAAALAKAKIQRGEAPDQAVISANETVAKQYGLTSILDIPEESDKYSQLLAGFSQLAKNQNVQPGELVEALAKDWSDGSVDGKENAAAVMISGNKALGNAGTTGLTNATTQFTKSGKDAGSKEATATVNPPATKTPAGLTIATKSLPAWVSGQQGSYAVTASGGSAPVTWSVKGGGLPEGFKLSQDGIISGSFSLPSGVSKKIFPQFTLEARDQKGETKTVTLTITIVTEAPKITAYNPPTLTVDQSYDEKIATANGGMPPYRFYREAVSGPMPMGMQITSSGSNAILSGSPQAKGNFSFRVCVVDSADTEKCGSVAFKVEEAPADTNGCPTPWDGTWSGTFQQTGNRWYKEDWDNRAITHPYSFSFNVEFTAKCESYFHNSGWASLKINHAAISNPFFGCEGGCNAAGTFSTETDGKETFISISLPNGTHLVFQQMQLTGNSITAGGHTPDVYFGDSTRLEDAFYDVEGARQGWPACQLSIDCYPSPLEAHYNITLTKE